MGSEPRIPGKGRAADASGEAARASAPAPGKQTAVERAYGGTDEDAQHKVGHGASPAATERGQSRIDALFPSLARAMPAGGGGGAAAPTIHDAATAAVEGKGAGSPVDGGIASRVGGHLGVELSGVRVHQDPLAQEASAAIGARAFAHGSDVFLGKGESPTDMGLMAHELTHVAQQGAAGRRAPQRKIEVGDANSPAEHEADQVAADVTSGRGTPAELLVDDGPLAAGQMHKEAFLAALRVQVTAAADTELGPLLSAAGCPYIAQYFARYEHQPARACEALLRRYAPGAGAARTAADLIPAVVARVRAGVRTWRDTGEPPPDLSSMDPAAASAVAANGAGAQALRAPDGRETLASLEADLGPGQPLPAGMASRMSAGLGVDVSSARVHVGDVAARKAAAVDAVAFAVGHNVVMGASAPAAGSLEGDALLAHELAHTVQQRDAATDPVARRKPIGEESAAAEEHADDAAAGAVAAMHGRPGLLRRAASALKTGLQLQRCGGKKVVVPADPYLAKLHARLHAKPRDLAGFYADITADAKGHAGNAATRAGFDTFVADGVLSYDEAVRAVVLSELLPERDWPLPIKNFVAGVDAGTFHAPALLPAGADPLLAYCVRAGSAAGDAAGDVLAAYRTDFNAKWNVAPYSAEPTTFDATLDSKGPRNKRARKIFEALYATRATGDAYDKDTPPGFRALCDTHSSPDGANLIASPRLHALRAELAAKKIAAPVTGTGDAAYTAVVTAVRPKAVALDPADRKEVELQHEWRQIVDDTVKGNTLAVTTAVRADLWSVVSGSFPPAGAAPPVTPPPAEPAPAIDAPKKTFLDNIALTATPPQDAPSDRHPVTFSVKSTVPNPGLAARRHIVVEPSANVPEGQDDETAWPAGTDHLDHTAKVNPESTVPGTPLKLTARVTMPPVAAADFAEKKVDVEVKDKRADWVKTNLEPAVIAVSEMNKVDVAAGNTFKFYGGQLPLRVAARFKGGGTNPGLTLGVEGDVKQAGAVVKALDRRTFPSHGESTNLPDAILVEPTPPPGAPQDIEITLRVFQGAAPGVLMHTIPALTFKAEAGLPPAVGGDAGVLTADNDELNQPIGTAGTFLNEMKAKAPSATSAQARVADAVASGALKLRACIRRSDSATWLTAKGQPPDGKIAWAMGQIDDAHTMIDPRSGQAGWHWPKYNDHVFLNVTLDTHAGAKRPRAQLFDILAHEGIHAADRPPTDKFGRYEEEFRAYWIDGTGAGKGTGYDETLAYPGPKSPRARAIFDHLYYNPTYAFVREFYDSNADGFRAKVDRYFAPDGVNLALSGALTDLRQEIESYAGAGYPAKKTAVTAKLGACSAADKAEIAGNRAWRDLVELKFTGTVVVSPGPPPVTAREKDEIKTILGIPR